MMFSLHKNDQIVSLKKLEGMSHLDVALKVSIKMTTLKCHIYLITILLSGFYMLYLNFDL